METIVAMVIVTTVMVLWSNVYLKIATRNGYDQQQCGENLLRQAMQIAKEGSGNAQGFEQVCKGKAWVVSYNIAQEGLVHVVVEIENQKPRVKFQGYVYVKD